MNQINRNDAFSKLRGIELQELLVEIINFPFEYRNTLHLPNNLTFGFEIEYEGLFRIFVRKFLKNKKINWEIKKDGTLRIGGEITSSVLTDNKKNWQELRIICEYLKNHNADTLHNAGGHTHIGANILGDDIQAWKTYLKLHTYYEHIYHRFDMGDKVSERKNQNMYAAPISNYLYDNLEKINDAKTLTELMWILCTVNRYKTINFNNVKFHQIEKTNIKNTIEFRGQNPTTNEVIWQNYINAKAKTLISSKTIDQELLDYKLKHSYKLQENNKFLYKIIVLQDALELVDLIFDNNLDKMYFLKQYLKDFEENYAIKQSIYIKKLKK